MTTQTQDAFLQRLIIEEEDLGTKLVALATALESPGFSERVGNTQFDLLNIQRSAMATYRQVLRMRIKDLHNRIV
jgi:hypothetical protein